jgi:pimeloyl-ACP methyl ester carboxylesterase
VCAYDRAGLGFSDPAGLPRDASAVVRDLHALLQGAAIAPPYVLVGWSSGGLYTRLYQYRFPHEVAGLVEVDPDSEFETSVDDSKIVVTMMRKSPQWFDRQMHDWYKQCDDCALHVEQGTCAFFPGLAAYRRALRAAGCPAVSRAACAIAEVHGEHMARPSLWKDEASELELTDKSAAEVRAARRPYGNLPIVVLTDAENRDIDTDHPIISIPAQRAMWVAKDDAEESIAKLSTVGAHFVVDDSPHAILLYQPSVVISAIDEVIYQVRYNRRT